MMVKCERSERWNAKEVGLSTIVNHLDQSQLKPYDVIVAQPLSRPKLRKHSWQPRIALPFQQSCQLHRLHSAKYDVNIGAVAS